LFFDAESHLCTNAAKIRGDYFGPEHRGERKGTGGVAGSSTIGGLFRRVRESMPRASGIVAKHKTALSAWKAYERNERLGRRLSSVSWFILLFVAPCCLAYLFFGWPMKPVRGTFCWVIDFVFELAAFFCIAFLTLAVLDRCIAVRLLVKSLTSEEAKWHPAALNRYSAEIPGGCEAAGHWLDIEVLAKRTAAVERTLYGPFVLVVLLGISRDSNFDNWGWPVVFIVIEAVLLAAAIVSVGMLRHSAELARREALSRLDESTEKARGEREQGEHEVELLNRLAERVRNERRGAFSPFLDNPVLRALLIPLTGFGSWRVIQTFFQ